MGEASTKQANALNVEAQQNGTGNARSVGCLARATHVKRGNPTWLSAAAASSVPKWRLLKLSPGGIFGAEFVVGVGGRQRGACARPTGGGAPGVNTYATSDEGLDMTIAWYLGHESWMDSVTTGEYVEFARRLYGG
jgi:hypothetical protein